jgi:nitroreductase
MAQGNGKRMEATMKTGLDQQHWVLEYAVERAVLAPSVHNTQPWRFLLKGEVLELHADRGRQLNILDPSGRQLLISCGCALFNARAALASRGYQANVERLPERDDPTLLARITISPGSDRQPIGNFDHWVEARHTNRRRFAQDIVAPQDVYDLVQAALAEDTQLFTVTDLDHRLAAARLSQEADGLENADPAYRAELRTWTTDDPTRRDGVAAVASPHVDGAAEDDIPIRDFDTRGAGSLPAETHSSINQCLLLLGVTQDSEYSWLRAGEALERVLLEATRLGYAASPLTQVIEIPSTRERLRVELNLSMHPVVLLRVGRAPLTSASRRRLLDDVLVDSP